MTISIACNTSIISYFTMCKPKWKFENEKVSQPQTQIMGRIACRRVPITDNWFLSGFKLNSFPIYLEASISHRFWLFSGVDVAQHLSCSWRKCGDSRWKSSAQCLNETLDTKMWLPRPSITHQKMQKFARVESVYAHFGAEQSPAHRIDHILSVLL